LRPTSWLAEAAQATIEKAAADGHPNEVGGVLIGVLTEVDRPWVTEAVVIPSARPSGTYFELPEGARPDAVDRARARDSRLGYLGDWHSHPADVGPSSLDRQTMRAVAEDPEAAWPEPILLIVRRRGCGYRLDVRQLVRGRLRKARVTMSGGLIEDGGPVRPRRVRSKPRRHD
jgi:proteasome lid subunit RPN8/RPN11